MLNELNDYALVAGNKQLFYLALNGPPCGGEIMMSPDCCRPLASTISLLPDKNTREVYSQFSNSAAS